MNKTVRSDRVFPHPRSLISYELNTPEWAFEPDNWTTAFERGLEKVDWDNKRVLEIGVGTGINEIFLLSEPKPPKEIYGTDIDPRALALSKENVRAALPLTISPEGVCKYKPYSKPFSLLAEVKDGELFDIIFACVPQVPVPNGVDISEADNRANYFLPSDITMEIPPSFLAYGLALNYQLLVEAREHLIADGAVILNLSGRAGASALEALFETAGYAAEILYEEIVLQHPSTSLSELVKHEEDGLVFEFFSDASASTRITAKEAEQLRKNRDAAGPFHKIYVMSGILRAVKV